jgi:hypothetical protein
MSRSPRIVETSVVINSGADVPIATTVNPISASDTPSCRDTPTAPSTSQSAPTTSSAMPPTVITTSVAARRLPVVPVPAASGPNSPANSSATSRDSRRADHTTAAV